MNENSKKITIRVSPEEYEFLKNEIKNSGVLQRNFFINAVKKRPSISKDFLQNLERELKNQGNNFNQITKKINEKNLKEISLDELKQIFSLIKNSLTEQIKTWQLLNAFLQKNL